MPSLIAPTVRLHASWLESRDEWGPGVHQDGSGLRRGEDIDVDTPAGFAAWVAGLLAQEDPSIPAPTGLVHCTYRWIVEDDRILGGVGLRHRLNDFLLNVGGHIGYGVRPSARGQGLATWALGETLGAARKLGLDRVLVTCVPSNVASARVIEKQGGVLEDVRTTGADTVKRYWITL